MRKRLLGILVLVAVFVGVGLMGSTPSEAARAAKWKIAHTRPMQAPLHKDLEAFAKKVEEVTEGRVTLQVFGGGQLGGSEVVMERVGLGTIEMMAGWPNTSLDPQLEIYALAGMCKDFDQAAKVYHTGSPFMNIVSDLYAKQNLKILSSYVTYFGAMAFKSEPENPLDPDAKHNQKIRIPPMNSYRYMIEALGYLTTPLPWGEVFTALQTGIIDGVGGPGAEPVYLVLRDMVKYFLPANLYVDVWFISVNQEVWDDLSDADQKAIQQVAYELETKRFKDAADEKSQWEHKLSDSGVHVYEVSDEQLGAFQKKIMDYAWPRLREDIGAEFFDKAVQAAEESLQQ